MDEASMRQHLRTYIEDCVRKGTWYTHTYPEGTYRPLIRSVRKLKAYDPRVGYTVYNLLLYLNIEDLELTIEPDNISLAPLGHLYGEQALSAVERITESLLEGKEEYIVISLPRYIKDFEERCVTLWLEDPKLRGEMQSYLNEKITSGVYKRLDIFEVQAVAPLVLLDREGREIDTDTRLWIFPEDLDLWVCPGNEYITPLSITQGDGPLGSKDLLGVVQRITEELLVENCGSLPLSMVQRGVKCKLRQVDISLSLKTP